MTNKDQSHKAAERAARRLLVLRDKRVSLVELSDDSSTFAMRVLARAYAHAYDEARKAVWVWLECSDKDAEDVVDRAMDGWVRGSSWDGRGAAQARQALESVADELELLA